MGLRAHGNDDSGKTKSKWMWGCCGGCAGVGLVTVVGLIIFGYLMVRSKPVVPPETFFQTKSDAFAILQLRPEHHDLATFLQQMAKNPPSAFEMTREQKQKLKNQADNIPSQLAEIAPMQMVIQARKLEQRRPRKEMPEGVQWKFLADWLTGIGLEKRFSYGTAVSIRAYSGVVSWTLSGMINKFVEQGGHIEQHGDVDIGVPPEENFYLAVLDNNFMLADERDTITTWIDDLQKAEPTSAQKQRAEEHFRGPKDLEMMYKKMNLQAPVVFATSNAEGEIESFLQAFQELGQRNDGQNGVAYEMTVLLRNAGLASDSVYAFGGYFAMDNGDSGTLHLYTQCADRQAAQAMDSRWNDVLSQSVFSSPDVRTTSAREGDMVRVEITVQNLEQTIRGLSERQD